MYSASLLSPSLRRFGLFCLFSFAIGSAALAQSNSPSAADGYDPNVDGNVYALVTQADGKLLVGGLFSVIQPNGAATGSNRGNLARLNADGSVDAFSPATSGAVNAIAVQPDGKILIGGAFSSVNGTARNRIARLNADGSLDTSFNPNLGDQLSDVQVNAIALQADGRIVVGGSFTSKQVTGAATGLDRNRLLRLEATGALDPLFNPDLNNAVFALAVQPNGQILAGGSFTTAGAVTRNRIARFNSNGTLDAGFDPNASGTVNSLLVLTDNKIVLGGTFTNLQPPNASAAIGRNSLARLNADGTIDTTFAGGANASVTALALQPDGKLVVGGTFSTLWPASGVGGVAGRNFTGRFNADGSLDDNYNPSPNGQVRAIVTQLNGSVILGGLFTQLRGPAAFFGTLRNHLARVNPDGTPDATLDLGAGGGVIAMATDSSGRVVVGGTFNSVGGATRNYLARINTNGTLDTTFNPVLDGRVLAVAIDSDGKVLIGGVFSRIGDVTRSFLARLNANGTLDDTFKPNPNAAVNSIAIQSDKKILIGGSFTALQPNTDTTLTARNNYARLNTDGTVDSGYSVATNGVVFSIRLQSDGKAVIAGNFQAVQQNSTTAPATRNAIARINTDGSIDAAYDPNPNSQINAIALQGDKIIAVGSFTQVQANGAATATTRNRIARFNADGTLDTGFNPDANSAVNFVSVLPNGKVLAGGTLTKIGSSEVKEIALLNSDGTLDATFNPRPNNRVLAVIPVSDTSILLGGTFTFLQPGGTGTPTPANRIVRVSATGAVDSAFAATVGGQPDTAQVKALAFQADGKLLVGGTFADLGGTTGSNVARFQADGTPDTRFVPSANGTVNAIAVRPDIGAVTPQGTGFAWVNPDGTLRPGFSTDPNSKFIGRVNSIARQPDGKIILGGAFTNSSGATGANLARFFPDGRLDGSFNPGPNSTVTSVIALADGSVLVAGSFTSLAGVTRNRIARFTPAGALDTTFDPNASSTINAMVVQSDGKILVGGAFASFQPNGATSVTARANLARLESNGTVDGGFNPNPNAEVTSLALQSDGKIVVGGLFSSLQPAGATTGTTRVNLARVNGDGTLDTGFNPQGSGPVYALVIQPNGKILIGGSFSAIGGIPHANVARVETNGGVDFSFYPQPNGQVSAIALTPTGHILLGGFFTSVAGTPRNRIARVDSNGSIDTTFDANANDGVSTILLNSDGSIMFGGGFTTLQPNGAIVVGGAFTNVGGAPVNNLVFLNDDGTATALRPNPNGAVNALLIQSDGKIVVGGAFDSIGNAGRNRIARLNADGAVDSTFNPNANGAVNTLAQQADGKLLVGGGFTSIGGGSANGVARLNTDGSLDSSFTGTTGLAGLAARALAVQSDGRILMISAGSGVPTVLRRMNSDGSVDGTFVTGSIGSADLRTLVLQTDGKILVGGDIPSIAGGIVRLNSDGSVDASFDPNVNGAVNTIALQTDGKPVIGGAFSRVGGLPRVRVARLRATTAAPQSIVATSSTTLQWRRSGANPEVASVAFEQSTDGRTWTTIGQATRVSGTPTWWSVTTSGLPAASTIYYARVRAIVPTTNGGSSSIIEAAAQIYFTPPATVTSAPSAGGATDRSFLYAVGATNNPTAYSAAGLPAGLAIDATTGIISGTPSQAGVFDATLTVTNAGGTTTRALTLTITPATGAATGSFAGHLLDISCLAHVDAAHPLITGFIITGDQSKSVLLRAVGPGLVQLGVTNVLAAPRLQLYSSNGQQLLDNSSWGGESSLANVFAQAGEFPLSPSSSDAAAAVTLAPGGYTVVVTDNAGSGSGGIVLAEIYDVAGGTQQFSAMSARGHVAPGAPLTAGFVITGDVPRRFLVRGVGPGLSASGVTDAVSDTVVGVYNMQGGQLAFNDNWETPVAGGASGAELSAAALSVGNYAFASGAKDAALIVTLAPGTYTAQAAGSGSARGAAIVEIYELP